MDRGQAWNAVTCVHLYVANLFVRALLGFELTGRFQFAGVGVGEPLFLDRTVALAGLTCMIRLVSSGLHT